MQKFHLSRNQQPRGSVQQAKLNNSSIMLIASYISSSSHQGQHRAAQPRCRHLAAASNCHIRNKHHHVIRNPPYQTTHTYSGCTSTSRGQNIPQNAEASLQAHCHTIKHPRRSSTLKAWTSGHQIQSPLPKNLALPGFPHLSIMPATIIWASHPTTHADLFVDRYQVKWSYLP